MKSLPVCNAMHVTSSLELFLESSKTRHGTGQEGCTKLMATLQSLLYHNSTKIGKIFESVYQCCATSWACKDLELLLVNFRLRVFFSLVLVFDLLRPFLFLLHYFFFIVLPLLLPLGFPALIQALFFLQNSILIKRRRLRVEFRKYQSKAQIMLISRRVRTSLMSNTKIYVFVCRLSFWCSILFSKIMKFLLL
ncbi:unnamed protein product [Moneuplotes crassus]|uniref:Uncharacterized protein n=1 Tax=Euplotes crassus TaxID=5936 RepID=A0AAD1URD0_EUPCR|nr:unnamed protein product [Moneuplotes crassus]